VGACTRRVGQHAQHALAQGGVGLEALAVVAGGQRLEPQPVRRLAVGRRAEGRQLGQGGRQFAFGTSCCSSVSQE
jgi:hypothetical protein